ncbi:MAG: putative porin, partial [Pseudomonadota bacterium]|nr:putative porin [Pseudomonadota bacterium]
MKRSLAAVALGVFLSASFAASAETDAAVMAELEQLRAQVAALVQRVEQLEQSQPAPATAGAAAPADSTQVMESRLVAIEETNDRQTDQLAQNLASSGAMDWARRIRWKGDLRYRHEQFDVEGAASDRVRHRLRARFGLDAKVSDSIAVGLQIATSEGRDSRSTNSTLDAANQHEE